MAILSRFQKYAVVGLGACSGVAIYYFGFHTPAQRVSNSWTTNYEPSKWAKWDYNWDHRQPESQIKPPKLTSGSGEDQDNKYNTSLENVRPKATRHIFLIRHGQYNLDGKSDKERILTDLGRKQAQYTGERLQELDIPYTKLVKSTMTRAQETASIIMEYLKKVDVQDCSLIEEGAPVPPEPPVGHWKPELFFYQDGARIEAAYRKYFHRASPDQEKDSYTILVCHANVIRYFVCRALQFPAEAWLRISLNHASITWISITPTGRVILRTLGDSGHIPATSLTSR